MEGRINNIQFSAFRAQQSGIDAQRLYFGDIFVVNFPVADILQQPFFQSLLFVHQPAIRIFCGPDYAGNPFRNFRRHLSALFSVYFISVILRRIMACSNHDPGDRIEMANGKAQDRHRPEGVEQISGHSFPAKHKRGILCERIAAAAAVICNHDASFRLLGVLLQKPGQTFCRPANIIFIHPVHPGAENISHTGSPETQFRIKTVLDFLFVIPYGFQLFYSFCIIGKVFQPLFIVIPDIHCFNRLSAYANFLLIIKGFVCFFNILFPFVSVSRTE